MRTSRSLLSLFVLLLAMQLGAQNILVSLDSAYIPDVELGEVVISASRDNSKIKDIPSAITSIRASQIENNQIQSLEDASTFAPNFMMLDYGTKIMSPVYIRGIGSKKNSPSVGMYVDGIPYYENSSLSFDFFDLKSIEILRGPQGTLYGRNTIGGLININTLSPEDYQGTNLRLSSQQYNTHNITLSHYGKANKLAYSLSGNYRYQGGYFTNNFDNSAADKMQSYALRNRLIYHVNDKLSFENIFSVEKSSQQGYPYAVIDSLGNGAISYNEESGYDRLFLNEGLKAKYNSENWIAEATLSYQHIDDNQNIDQDFSDSSYYFVDQAQEQNMFSAEGLIRSKGNTRYKWLIGTFAFQQNIDKNVDVALYKSNINSIKDYKQQLLSAGVFHQSTFSITKKLTAIAGLRFNYEKSALDYKYNVLMGENTIPKTDTTYKTLEEFIPLPKLALTYALEDLSIYTSYSTGYKSGGYNSSFETEKELHFKKEMSHNFELGIKGSLFDNYIYSEIAMFLSIIEGQQILHTLPSGRGSFLENSGQSINKGVEFSLSSRPIAGFSTKLGYGYTKSEITDYVKDETTDYSGNTSPFVPKQTLNISLNHSIQTKNISFIDRINSQVNLQQVGEMYWNIDNTMKQDSYNLLNAQIGIAYKDINLSFWGKNITNTEYTSYAFSMTNPATGLPQVLSQTGKPSRFGTTLSMKF